MPHDKLSGVCFLLCNEKSGLLTAAFLIAYAIVTSSFTLLLLRFPYFCKILLNSEPLP